MALWGNSTSTESRPKWLGGDGSQGAGGATEDAFATESGWALRAGTIASGNDNASAQAEVLVCIGGLATTLGAANALSVDFIAGEYARGEIFDFVVTFDEAITVVSAAWENNNTVTNKAHIALFNPGPTDMVNDGLFRVQYYAGSGTNKITFRGTIPGSAVAGGFVNASGAGFAIVLDGNSTMKDAAAVNATIGDLAAASHGPGANAALLGLAIVKTGSTVNTLTTQAGSSSGTSSVLTGVTTAVS